MGFDDCIEVVSDQGRRLPESRYATTGRWPVVDQGANAIGGYTDDESLVFTGDLPIIAFGDHTRRVKLLRQPFVVGAQGLKLLRPRPHLDPQFLAYALSSAPVEDRGYSRHFQYLRRIALPVPPLAEQRRIVAALEEHLSDLDAAVAGLERAKANAGHLRTAALRRVFQDRHDPVERFEAVIESLRNGISTKPEGDAGLRILRISAVRPMRVDLHEVRFLPESADAYRDHLLVEGDLLFTRYNGNPGLVGACGMVGALAEATVYPDKLIRARVRRGRLDPRFAQIALSVGVSRAFIQSKVKTTAGQAGIAGADIKNVPIPLPDLKDQYAIIAEVEQRLTSVARLRAEIDVQLARAARLRQAILRRAFEGKLVARAPNDEPARELVSHGSATRDGVARPQQSRMRPRGSTR